MNFGNEGLFFNNSVHMAVTGQLVAISPVFLPYRFQASTLVARLGDYHLSSGPVNAFFKVVMPHSLQGVTSVFGLFILPNPFISNEWHSLKERL